MLKALSAITRHLDSHIIEHQSKAQDKDLIINFKESNSLLRDQIERPLDLTSAVVFL